MITTADKKEDYKDFLQQDKQKLEEARAAKWNTLRNHAPASMHEYFLLQSMQFLQSMKEDLENGIKLVSGSTAHQWKDQQEQMRAMLSHLMSGLRQNFMIQKFMHLAFDKSLKVATKYLKWLEQDGLTLRDSFEAALERIEYVNDAETITEFETIKIPSFDELIRCVMLANGSSNGLVKFEKGFDVEDLLDDMGRISNGGVGDEMMMNPDVVVKIEGDLGGYETGGEMPIGEMSSPTGGGKSGKYVCNYCGKRSENKWKHENHLRVHTKEKPFKCKICERDFTQKSSLNLHIRDVHSMGGIDCEVCGKTMKRGLSIVRHMRRVHDLVVTTEDYKKFKCDHCGKKLYTKEELDAHAEEHLINNKCKTCGKSFKSYAHLMDHQKKTNCKGDVDPLDDDNSFDADQGVEEIEDEEEEDDDDEVVEEEGDESIVKNEDSDWEDSEEAKAAGAKKKGKEFPCNFCGKVFNNKSKHTIHERTHTKEKPFQCDMCPKAFSTVWALNEHKHVHRNELFTCKLCNKTSKNRHEIANHIRKTHNLNVTLDDLRSEACDKCDKRFFTQEELAEHMIVHQGGFKCDDCGRSFLSAQYLSRHQNSSGAKCVGLAGLINQSEGGGMPDQDEEAIDESGANTGGMGSGGYKSNPKEEGLDDEPEDDLDEDGAQEEDPMAEDPMEEEEDPMEEDPIQEVA